MNVLVLNCGSSSLKFQIIQTDLEMIEKDADKQLAKGTHRTDRQPGACHISSGRQDRGEACSAFARPQSGT